MPPLRFNEDLFKAQGRLIDRVSHLRRGDDSGTLTFAYSHESLAEPVTIHMIAHDCMSYPKNAGFIVFSESDNADHDFTLCLDAACQKKKWSSIEEAVEAISAAITTAIEKPADQHSDDGASDDQDESQWDDGSDYQELDPMEISSADGDRQNVFDKFDDAGSPIDGPTLLNLRNSLRLAQSSGITVGIYPRAGSNIPEVISLSARASCLGVASAILESWGLKETDNLVLLLRIGTFYPSLREFLSLSSRQTALQFRFGKCLGEKPSVASVHSAYRDVKQFSDDAEGEPVADSSDQFPFELINMSNSIDKLLNDDFMKLLGTRRNHHLSWQNAQHIVSRLELQSAAGNVLAEEINVEILNTQIDHVLWQNLVGPISEDAALDDPDSFSLPLVAMQLALHRLANCTRYCMVCNACIRTRYQAIKPYVCDKSLCLFQYLSLGLGSSIEHEIINAPYVVDMLVSFLYTALVYASGRELPNGLSIKTAYVDQNYSQNAYVSAEADMEGMRLRNLQSAPLSHSGARQNYKDMIHEGDRVLIIHREPDPQPGSNMDILIKSWCRLIASVDEGEWVFECYHTSELKRTRHPFGVDSTLDDLSSTPLPGSGNWRRVQLFGYWQNIDELTVEQRRFALITILDGMPSVLEMRAYLMAQPGRRLATWSRMNASELAVLNWTVASNRSLIVQDDIVANTEMRRKSDKAWNKLCDHRSSPMPWMQFRFLQGSPEMEQKFEAKAHEVLKKTPTPTIFAWHGSRLKNWHSIIRTGLDFSVVENGRASGNGVYFSSEMTTSLGYSGRETITMPNQTNMVGVWPRSELAISSAIAVCELINCTEEFVSAKPHYVVDKLHWIQCRYLLVSTNPSAKAIEFPFYEPQVDETPAYVLQDERFQIIGEQRDVRIQIPVTVLPPDRRPLQTSKAEQQPTVMAKTTSTDSMALLKSRGQLTYDADDVELYLGVDGIGIDGNLHATAMKRRGSSTASDLSYRSQSSHKRAKPSTGSGAAAQGGGEAQVYKTPGFDPQGLKTESLRLLGAPTWASTSQQAIRRLAMDLKKLHHQQTKVGDLSAGYYVHTDKSDNMFQWIVELFNFDMMLPLARDMLELNCASIVLEFRFGPNYPMSPPFVRVIRPQFVPFAQGGGGHITIGGAVCLELLTNSGWNPAINIENVILQIRAAISEPERPARLDRHYLGADYGIGEAIAAFTRLAQAHGWAVPEDFSRVASL